MTNLELQVQIAEENVEQIKLVCNFWLWGVGGGVGYVWSATEGTMQGNIHGILWCLLRESMERNSINQHSNNNSMLSQSHLA